MGEQRSDRDAGKNSQEETWPIIARVAEPEAAGVRRHQLDPARVIGDYRIVRLVGSGGMGTIYEAEQLSMKRRVALKLLDTSATRSSISAVRFEREAWLGGRLSHPNIVRVYEHGSIGKLRFIAMELVAGGSLEEEMQKTAVTGQRPVAALIRTTAQLFMEVADALHTMHEQGIVHRDIKPSNLLLGEGGRRLLLTDFGLARDEEATKLTGTGVFLGTLRYMSPEQIELQDRPVDHRSDIWSLGVTLFEAVTGELPFPNRTIDEYLVAVTLRDATPARRINPDVPRGLEAILMRTLERDRDHRYQTAAELRDDLRRFLDDRPVLARRSGLAERSWRLLRRQRRVVGAAVLGLLLAVAVVAGVATWRQERRLQQRIRWTLTQVIATRADPNTLQPDWPELERQLREEVREEPGSELALLAARATPRIEAVVAAFARQGAPLDVDLAVRALLDPGFDLFCWYDIAGSWDSSGWEPLGSCPVYLTRDTEVVANRLQADTGDPGLSAAPHHLDLRTDARCFALDILSAMLQEAGVPESSPAAALELARRPELRDRQPFFSGSWSLGTHTVSVYREFAEGFPSQVVIPNVRAWIDRWFHVDRVVLGLAEPPAGIGKRFSFELLQSWVALTPPRQALLLVGMVLQGEIRSELPIPLAAQTTLRCSGTELYSFPLVFGGSADSPGLAALWTPERLVLLTGDDEGAYPVLSPQTALLARSILAQPQPGHLDLSPSRELALSSNVQHFLGNNVRIPVQIEARMVPVRRIPEDELADRTEAAQPF